MTSDLTLATFDVPARPMHVAFPIDPPEGGWTWPPISVTLIAGEQDAVLVDTVPLVTDAADLADWIEASGKRLTHIFITHFHVDHYLGTAVLTERFPDAVVVATAATAALLSEERETLSDSTAFAGFFVDPLVQEVVAPIALPDDGRIDLEGHAIVGVPVGRSDVSHSSFVWVPDLSAAIVGDIAYNDVHMPLFESDPEARYEWIETVREVQKRRPEIVIASHRKPDSVNDASPLADSIGYLETGDRLLRADPRPSLEEFVTQMIAAHPTRANVTTAIYSAGVQGLR